MTRSVISKTSTNLPAQNRATRGGAAVKHRAATAVPHRAVPATPRVASHDAAADRSGRPETGRAATGRPATGRAETGHAETSRAETGRPEIGRPATVHTETPRAATGRASTARPEIGRPATGRTRDFDARTDAPAAPDPLTDLAGALVLGISRTSESSDGVDEDEELARVDLSWGLDEGWGDDLVMPVVPIQPSEFTCSSCFLVCHRSRLAAGGDAGRPICIDCE